MCFVVTEEFGYSTGIPQTQEKSSKKIPGDLEPNFQGVCWAQQSILETKVLP